MQKGIKILLFDETKEFLLFEETKKKKKELRAQFNKLFPDTRINILHADAN